MESGLLAVKEKFNLKGHFTILRHPAGSVSKFLKLIKAGRIEEFLALQRQGEIAAEQDNTIMSGSGTGTDILGQWFGSTYLVAQGASVVPIGINYGAIGTGSTTPTTADTQLTTEYARASISFYQNSGFILPTLQFFFSDAQLANGSYPECGLFANATATANSGNIFNHALFSTPYAKTAGTDTTVQVAISI